MSEIIADGRHDFDFLHGRWRIHNRRLVDARDPGSSWREFDAHIEAYPILGGLGNIDTGRYDLDGEFEGLSLRLFEPATGLWRIWWASTRRPGHMDPPVLGRFVDGHGEFVCDDVLDRQPIKVRFEWTETTGGQPLWKQAFSFNEGSDWLTNWVMIFTREDGPIPVRT